MEKVRGYFTVERNLLGLSPREMETRLGFRKGRLDQGARVLLILKPPKLHEFVFAGSTRYSNAEGLVDVKHRQLTSIPHAWRGQRLVKVDPALLHSEQERYPSAESPIEQWQLIVPVEGSEICRLAVDQAYWAR